MKHYNENNMVKGILMMMDQPVDEMVVSRAAAVVEQQTNEKPEKVKQTLEAAGFTKGQHVIIKGEGLPGRSKNLDGRFAQVEEITNRGFIRVQLVNNKNGKLQGCLVPMPTTALITMEERLVAAV